MKFRWSRAACGVLAVASLGAALSGCVALVGGSAVMAGMSVADRRTTGTQAVSYTHLTLPTTPYV